MSWQDCAETIRSAARRDLDDAEIMAIMDDLDARATALRHSRPDLSQADLIRQAAKSASAEADLSARIEARNRKMNLLKRVERRSFYESAPSVLLGVEAKLVGVNTPFAGNRLSVATQAHVLTRDLLDGLTVELESAGLFRFVKNGKGDLQIAQELFALNHPDGEPGSSGHAAAAQAAAIIHKFQEAARLGLNKQGGWIGQYDGWIARTSHDADRIRRSGFSKWRDDILPHLDERTFDGVSDRDGFLQSVYHGLITGIHLTQDGMQGFKDPAFSGPSNLAKRLSQGRKLHFRDADAWMAYQADYGGKTLIESVLGGLQTAARSTALMREFGTNPRAEFEADLRYLQESRRDVDPATAEKLRSAKWLHNRFDELDGTVSRPVHALTAKIGATMRVWNGMSKLGGVVLSSITDIPLRASELRYQGLGWLESYSGFISSLARNRGTGRDRIIINQMLAGVDGMRGDIASRFDAAADTPPGVLSKLANTFFRWTGLTYWTNALRTGAEFQMAEHLGRHVGVDHADLPADLQRMLLMFDIRPDEWNVLHGVDLLRGNDGSAYLTPDRALHLSDDVVSRLIGDKLEHATQSMLANLEKSVSAVGKMEDRLRRLDGLLSKDGVTQNHVDAIDVRATVRAYEKQLSTVSKLRDKILSMRDGGATANDVQKSMRREIQRLVDAEKKITAEAVRRMDAMSDRIQRDSARRVEAGLAAERAKAVLLDRLDDIASLPDRLAAEHDRLRDQARNDLAMKLHAYFADRGEYAVLAPGARERAILHQGTKAGTIEGEGLRLLTQFKAFPVAMISKVWGREVHGGNDGARRIAGIVHMMAATTLFGYLAGALKDISKGRNPRDPRDPATWGAAFLQGGAWGIYGDFLMGKTSRIGSSALETAAGPTATTAADLIGIWNGVRAGDDKSAASLRFVVQNTPFINLFYTRAALDYLFLYQIQEAMNPGFLRRFEAQVKRDNNQTFWLRPTHAVGVNHD